MPNTNTENISTNTAEYPSKSVPDEAPIVELGTINIFGVIAFIIIVIIGLITFRRNHRYQVLVAASEVFRSSFVPLLKAIDNEDLGDRDILQTTFDDIHAASIKFKGYLRGETLRRFEEDWGAYQKHCIERVNVSVTELIASEALDPSKINDPIHIKEVAAMRKTQIKHLVESLLSYCK